MRLREFTTRPSRRDPNDLAAAPVRPPATRSFEPSSSEKDSLPPELPSRTRLTKVTLPAYIRDHNGKETMKLHIWSGTSGKRSESSSVVVRVSIPDVLVAYATLDDGEELLVESIAVFGPRERRPIYTQSEYAVFRKVWWPLRSYATLAPDKSVDDRAHYTPHTAVRRRELTANRGALPGVRWSVRPSMRGVP